VGVIKLRFKIIILILKGLKTKRNYMFQIILRIKTMLFRFKRIKKLNYKNKLKHTYFICNKIIINLIKQCFMYKEINHH